MMHHALCRETIAKFVGNTFPGPIYPGYADRLAAGKFEVTPSSPGFPVTGQLRHLALVNMCQICCNTRCMKPCVTSCWTEPPCSINVNACYCTPNKDTQDHTLSYINEHVFGLWHCKEVVVYSDGRDGQFLPCLLCYLPCQHTPPACNEGFA